MRCTADCVRPTSAAIDRVNQCVASLGVLSSVLTTTSSTCSSVTVRGWPGRGSAVRERLVHVRHGDGDVVVARPELVLGDAVVVGQLEARAVAGQAHEDVDRLVADRLAAELLEAERLVERDRAVDIADAVARPPGRRRNRRAGRRAPIARTGTATQRTLPTPVKTTLADGVPRHRAPLLLARARVGGEPRAESVARSRWQGRVITSEESVACGNSPADFQAYESIAECPG
jgi:hypothetical protein